MWPWITATSIWVYGELKERAGGHPWDQGSGSWWWGENSIWGRWVRAEAKTYQPTTQKLLPLFFIGIVGFIVVTKWKPR